MCYFFYLCELIIFVPLNKGGKQKLYVHYSDFSDYSDCSDLGSVSMLTEVTVAVLQYVHHSHLLSTPHQKGNPACAPYLCARST